MRDLCDYGTHCDNFFAMSTLAEIEAAADALPAEQKEELIRFLSARLRQTNEKQKARLVREGDDVLLEAPPGALPMTPDNVKRMLEDWP
jgi:hypothetical protein